MDKKELLDESKLFEHYPKKLIKKMKENISKEYTAEELREKAEYPDLRENDPIFSSRDQETIRAFKGLMESLTGSQLPRKVELQLIILEDIIMNFLTPYTRQLFLTRISKHQSV